MPGIDLVGSSNWAAYKQLMRDAQETFGKKIITWVRSAGGIDRFAEDNATEAFVNLPLEVILQNNVGRTWPTTQNTEQGAQDKESIFVIINKEYLQENGYLNGNGNFNFNPEADRFLVDGIEYKCQGFIDSSQDNTENLWVNIIIERTHFNTGAPQI